MRSRQTTGRSSRKLRVTHCRDRCPAVEVAQAEEGCDGRRNIATMVTGSQLSGGHLDNFMLIATIFSRRSLHLLGVEGREGGQGGEGRVVAKVDIAVTCIYHWLSYRLAGKGGRRFTYHSNMY